MQNDPTRVDVKLSPLQQRMRGVTLHGNMEFDVPFISRIAPNLWQGGCAVGLILPTHINFLISLYPWERYTVNHKLDGELYIRMYDDPNQSLEQVEWLAELVNRWRKKGEVLVHCQAGLNRSSLVAGRALTKEGLKGWEAIKLLREQRSPACLCNVAFERYLRNIG